MIIASQNQDYVDEGLLEYQDQIHKLQSKSHLWKMNGFLVRDRFNPQVVIYI